MKTLLPLPLLAALSLMGPACFALTALVGRTFFYYPELPFLAGLAIYSVLTVPTGVGIALSLLASGMPHVLSKPRLLLSGAIGGMLFGLVAGLGVFGYVAAFVLLVAALVSGIEPAMRGSTVLAALGGALLGIVVSTGFENMFPSLGPGSWQAADLAAISVTLPLYGLNFGALFALQRQAMRQAAS